MTEIHERNQEEAETQRLKQVEIQNADKKSEFDSSDDEFKERKKRRRRDEIQRMYECKVEGCGKSYGYNLKSDFRSENSLNQHMKNKHTFHIN